MSDAQSVSDESCSCINCSYESDSATEKCPQCGRAMSSARNIRRRGWVLVSIGVFIIIIVVVPVIMVAGASSADLPLPAHKDTVRIEHSTGMGTGLKMYVFGFIGLMISFGVVSLASGIWQIVYGKPYKYVKAIVVGLVFVLMAFSIILQFLR